MRAVSATPQRSGWLRTAVPAAKFAPVTTSLKTDALIIGGGITGLNAALRLLELGTAPVVVEAETIGFGASGRNGGQVIPGLKQDPDELIDIFGEKQGEGIIQFAGEAADNTFALIDRYKLDCAAEQNGWLQPALDESTLRLAVSRADSWAAATGARVSSLNRGEMASRTGTDFYVGGWIDYRGGQLQPLSYTRELARVACENGASLFERSPVAELRRNGVWTAEINGYTVTANSVLLCTNAYGELVPQLLRSLVQGSSIMCATAPLDDDLLKTVIPSKLPISDARRLMNYLRLDPDGRFMIGARGSFSLNEPQSYFAWLRKRALQIFPQLRGVKWEDSWGGLFALTADFLPHIHQIKPDLFALLGCNGRGVAILSQLGRVLAEFSKTRDPDVSPLPVTPVKPIPMHSLRRPGLEAILLWYRMLDALKV